MPLELLPLVRPELVPAREDADLVVQALAGQPLVVGRLGHGRHGVHGGVGDVLHVHGDVPLPHAQALVVGGGDEASVLVAEGDGVDGAQVPVVLLDDVVGARVPAHDLLVRGARQEEVLLVILGVELDAERDLFGENALGQSTFV